MKMTIKGIIRWEQLNKKAFSQLNENDENEIISLLYTCSLQGGDSSTLDEFRANLKEDDAKKMLKEMDIQTVFSTQFQTHEKTKSGTGKQEDSTPVCIKEVVAMLIMNGLDAHYALNEMELYDLPMFVKAYDQRVKENLTAGRAWAHLQLLPHLKKGTSPKDIHPFIWELEEENAPPKYSPDEAKAEFKALLKNGIKI